MVTTLASPHYRYTVVYTEASTLSRILDAIGRFGVEPARLLSRLYSEGFYRADMCLVGLCPMRAETLAARISNLPMVINVQYVAKEFLNSGLKTRVS